MLQLNNGEAASEVRNPFRQLLRSLRLLSIICSPPYWNQSRSRKSMDLEIALLRLIIFPAMFVRCIPLALSRLLRRALAHRRFVCLIDCAFTRRLMFG